MRHKHRIPRVVDLGLGFKIKVTLVSQRMLKEIAEDDASYDGLWMDEEKTIYIDKKLTVAQKRATYWHELIHAINDITAEDGASHLTL